MSHLNATEASSLLARIRSARVGGAPWDAAEWTAMLAVYVPALMRHDARDVRAACLRWIEDHAKWPVLAELLAAVDRARMRREQAEPPQQSAERLERPSCAHPTIRNPARLRSTIAHIKAHPGDYVAPATLIEIGEGMLERAGLSVEP